MGKRIPNWDEFLSICEAAFKKPKSQIEKMQFVDKLLASKVQ